MLESLRWLQPVMVNVRWSLFLSLHAEAVVAITDELTRQKGEGTQRAAPSEVLPGSEPVIVLLDRTWPLST